MPCGASRLASARKWRQYNCQVMISYARFQLLRLLHYTSKVRFTFAWYMATSYKGITRLSLLTPVLVAFCVYLMGSGHGWYIPTMVLFPWATLNLIWQEHLSEPLLIAGIFQFVVYGFVIDRVRGSKNYHFVVTSIILSHITLAILILELKNPDWR